MNSRRIIGKCLALGLIAMALSARAGLLVYDQDFTTGFANNGDIPDGNQSGWQNSQVLSGLTSTPITDLRVTVNVSGGWNGDLYGWLRHETTGGTGFSVLLNRVGTPGNSGFGYGDTGFAITLSASGTSDLHNYQSHSPSYSGSGQLTGIWQPDGVGFNSFSGLDANGTWTLFLADMSGGFQSHLDAWGMEIEVVPEPVNVALGIFLAIFCLLAALRNWKKCGAWVRKSSVP